MLLPRVKEVFINFLQALEVGLKYIIDLNGVQFAIPKLLPWQRLVIGKHMIFDYLFKCLGICVAATLLLIFEISDSE